MTPDENYPGELTDNDLDQLLAAANKDLLTHIEAATDPTSALTAITVRTISAGAEAQRRRQPFRPGWPIAVAAAIVLAIVVPVAFLAGKAGPHSSSPGSVNVAASSPVTSPAASSSAASSPSTSSPSAGQPPGAAAMTTLGSYLARSAAVRPTVQAAIDNVQNCSESPSSGEATLQQAISTRQDILHGLTTLNVSALPNGAQLVSTLTTVMQNSLNAENDYRAWLADLVRLGSRVRIGP